jgi:putative nucleotidyltransferase with HDIG domain
MSRIAIRAAGFYSGPGRLNIFGRRSGLWSAVLVTGAVFIGPLAVSWVLVANGVVTSLGVSAALGSAMSIVVSHLAGRWWERTHRSSDLLFSDLLLWGWLRRRAMQRRLANAAQLFPSTSGAEAPSDLHLAEPLALLRRLAADLEATDPYTHGHSRRVARYASLIAKRMDLPPAEVGKIRLAAALHDIGKLHTPRTILDKPGRLTEDEFAVVKRHPSDGADMIETVIEDRELVAIVRHHHERLDGRGYPSGLAADQIPLGARIIAVADTFDAITSKRSYRQSRPHKAALDIMRSEPGAQLDPDAVKAFRSAYFGRRWLWIPAGVVNAAGRLLASTAAHVADTAAITAGAAAIAVMPLITPIAPGTTSGPNATWPPAPNVIPSARSTAPVVVGAVTRVGAGVRQAHKGGVQRGQTQTHRVSVTPLPGHRPQPVPRAPHAPGAPAASGSSPPASPGRAGGSSGGSPAPPSTPPDGGAGGGRTVTAAGTTATAGPHGLTATTTVPGAPTSGASATASPSGISASGSAAGSGAGVTLKPGLPQLSLPALPSLPTLPSLAHPLG